MNQTENAVNNYEIPKDYISHSQVGMYLRCGEQYRRRYLENEVIPPRVVMLKGSGVHEGMKHNNRQKIESRVDLPKKDIIELSVVGFEDRVAKEGLMLTPDELSVGKDKIVGGAKDSIVSIAGLYADVMAPTIQPIHAEETIIINIPKLPPIKTVLDLIDDQKNVRDAKISGKKKSQKDVETSLQLTMYAIAFRVLKGELPASVLFDVLVDKKKPEYQIAKSYRDMEDFNAGLQILITALNGITKGVFLPAPEGFWGCDARYCGYYESCKYISKNKKVIGG